MVFPVHLEKREVRETKAIEECKDHQDGLEHVVVMVLQVSRDLKEDRDPQDWTDRKEMTENMVIQEIMENQVLQDLQDPLAQQDPQER